MKLHTTREWIINAEDQMAIDRSIQPVQQYTAIYRSTGVALDYAQDDYRDYTQDTTMVFWIQLTVLLQTQLALLTYTTNDNSHSWNVRGEILLEGNWGQFDQFTSVEGNTAGTLRRYRILGHR